MKAVVKPDVTAIILQKQSITFIWRGSCKKALTNRPEIIYINKKFSI